MRQAFSDDRVRHRLLQGFLLRLALAPDPDAFVLRGGMLVHSWFPDVNRPVRDVDLVCRLAYAPEDLRARLAAILAEPRVRDGVRFDASRFRLDPLWPDTDHPGLRLFAVGRADEAGHGAVGGTGEISVDVTFGLDVWPAAERRALAFDGGAANLWTCRPEMLIGRKLRVTVDLARPHWRAKDLADLWLMSRMNCAPAVVGEAIARAMPDPSRAAEVLDRAWWSEPHAAARWARFRRGAGPAFPAALPQVVDEVHGLASSWRPSGAGAAVSGRTTA